MDFCSKINSEIKPVIVMKMAIFVTEVKNSEVEEIIYHSYWIQQKIEISPFWIL